MQISALAHLLCDLERGVGVNKMPRPSSPASVLAKTIRLSRADRWDFLTASLRSGVASGSPVAPATAVWMAI